MMDLRQNFGTDPTKSVEGVWHEVGKGVRVKVARLSNPKAVAMRDRLLKPYAKLSRKGKLPDDVIEDVARKVMAEHVLVDWEGIELDGEPLPYSKENVIKVLADESLADFYDFVAELANDADSYREELDEAAAGN